MKEQNKTNYGGDLEWKCSRCGLLLGIVDKATRENLRIKVREQYYWVESAKAISTGCKRCGAFNRITSDQS